MAQTQADALVAVVPVAVNLLHRMVMAMSKEKRMHVDGVLPQTSDYMYYMVPVSPLRSHARTHARMHALMKECAV